MLMTGDGVFFAQTWHKSNLPPTRALFFSSAGTSAGGRNSLSSFPPTGPNPSTGSIQLPRRLFLPTSTTNNKKYTFCRAGLINGLLACCRKPCLNYVNAHPTGTMIQNPMARYLTLMYRLLCTVSKSWSDPLTRVGKPDGQAQPMS